MRTMMIGVPVLLVLAGLSLAALPQDPKVGREPIKYGDRMSRWIGRHFDLCGDRSVATEVEDADAFTLVAVGVDYAEFKREEMLTMVPLAVLRFAVGTPPK